MMHDHDFNLIAAIAEGAMSPADQAVAETSLAACDACQTDLELQREALAVLRESSPLTMTDIERAAVHRNVLAAITPTTKTVVLRPKDPWFQRLIPAMAAAAALVVVVGVGSVLINGGSDADTAADTTAAALAGESLRDTADEESAGSTGGAPFDDAADATTTTMQMLAPTATMVEDYGNITGDALKNLAIELGSVQESDDGAAYDLERVSLDAALVCAEIVAEEGTITFAARATVDGDAVEIYRRDGLIQVFLTADCSLTESFE